MDPAFAERNVNEGFSGGEKKRHEILQLELLKPKIAILDETDSGLDVDALRQVSEGINRVRENGEVGTLLVTHYTRILRYIKPDYVHVFAGGRIVESGGAELADKLETEGYESYMKGGAIRVTSAAGPPHGPTLLDEAIRKDFPMLDRVVHDGKKIVYLDNAATSQKPRQVLDALNEYYEQHNANVHRGVYLVAEEATALYEGARDKVAAFINAPSRDEVIFTKNASESLNLVANMLGWADEPYRVDQRHRDRHHGDGAPLQHRAVAAARAAHRREAEVVRPDRRRPARPVEHRRDHHREDEDRLLRAGLQPARHRTTRSRRSSAARSRSARWSASTPRRPPRTCRWTCRRSRPTSWPSPATRCAARPASACCGAARSSWRTCRRSSAAAR